MTTRPLTDALTAASPAPRTEATSPGSGAEFGALLANALRSRSLSAVVGGSDPSAADDAFAFAAGSETPMSFNVLALGQALGAYARTNVAPAARAAQQPQHAEVPAAVPPELRSIVAEAAHQYDLDPALLAAVIKVESGFNPRAGSPAGAKGLMQLMDATARSLGVTDSFDPRQNVMGGARYLRNMLDRYRGDLSKALAAYNAGPGNVDRYGGIPPFAETQRYVPLVLAARDQMRAQG